MANIKQGSESLETTVPTRIGAGSFATIYSSPGRPVVFKVVHIDSKDHTAQIRGEFNILHSVYTQCNSDSIFTIPRALAFYDPKTEDLLFFPPSPGLGRRRGSRRPFNPEFFANLPPRSCYVMDRVAPLPRQIGTVVRSSFYPEKAIESDVQAPLLCRLYFGKEPRPSTRPSAFINPTNFPLDVARYDLLWDKCQNELDTKEEVAEGMGQMLSRIHWIAGYDARDVEFVLAGSPDTSEVRLYVIDFNQIYSAQMRAFDKDNGEVSELVDAFFANDPYYPRPVPTNPLYGIFKQMYMESCPEEHRARGALFLEAIEARYAEKSVTV